jgi:hypothetical protein
MEKSILKIAKNVILKKISIKNNILKNFLKRNIPFHKIATINMVFLINYYWTFYKTTHKLYAKSSNFNYLLDLNTNGTNSINSINDSNSNTIFNNFTKKKCPKIIYLTSNQENTNTLIEIEQNFEKIHSKYKELESYHLDTKQFKQFKEKLEKLLEFYGTSIKKLYNLEKDIDDLSYLELKENLNFKPFIFLNKYGDVKSYSLEEFKEIAKGEMIYNYFEKMSILHNKNDLLLMNDYDNYFLIYLDNKNIDYSNQTFEKFRKIYFSINFFNVKFFVATPEHSGFLKDLNNINELELNNVYLLKRHNMMSDYLPKNNNIVEINKINIQNDEFELINLTEDLNKINQNLKDGKIYYFF